jgi:peptide/nickel transport system substrate-binding protein
MRFSIRHDRSRPLHRSGVVRALAASFILAGLLLPASVHARGVQSQATAIKHGGTVTVSQGPAGSWTANFNPWAPAMTNGTGMIWEPLLWFNLLKGGKLSPWLAKSYKWSKDGKTLTFNLRPGVTWNDGKPFTSKDVLFSYQMAVKYPDFGYCTCHPLPLGSAAGTASCRPFIQMTSPRLPLLSTSWA